MMRGMNGPGLRLHCFRVAAAWVRDDRRPDKELRLDLGEAAYAVLQTALMTRAFLNDTNT